MITELTAKNFLRLRAVTIKPDGSVVQISGRNAQGKTSVLTALRALMGGKACEPPHPVRHGADQADLMGIIDVAGVPKYRVEKVLKPDGTSRLTLRSPDGKQLYASPQAVLQQFYTDLGFDPAGFTRMKATEQADIYRRLLGIDFSQLDRTRAALYDQRTQVNRDGKAAAGALIALPEPPAGTPEAEVDATDISRQLRDAHQQNAASDRAGHEVGRIRQQIAEAEAALKALQARLEAAEATLARMPSVDTAALEEALANAQAINAAVRVKQARAEAEKRVEAMHDRSEALTRQIDALDGDRRLMIESAEHPLEGMSFDDKGRLTYQGVPLEQASQMEQLKIASAIGLRLKPLLIVQEGSFMDSANFTEYCRWAEEFCAAAGAGCVWVERVSDGEPGLGFVIEDGAVLDEVPA